MESEHPEISKNGRHPEAFTERGFAAVGNDVAVQRRWIGHSVGDAYANLRSSKSECALRRLANASRAERPIHPAHDDACYQFGIVCLFLIS